MSVTILFPILALAYLTYDMILNRIAKIAGNFHDKYKSGIIGLEAVRRIYVNEKESKSFSRKKDIFKEDDAVQQVL
ncbi:hypothetical protein [Oceanobacillus damuensis]|uniref:hypothetical protein n=1 Tax=Oceanobacillus damuensis TaxID=937928 RepID=UPI0008325211|nr:hypothetical protein [Oceanobacillus damuensis]